MGVAVGWVTHFLDGTALLAHVASSGECNYYSPACIELCLMIKSLCAIAETVYRYIATLQYLVLQYTWFQVPIYCVSIIIALLAIL